MEGNSNPSGAAPVATPGPSAEPSVTNGQAPVADNANPASTKGQPPVDASAPETPAERRHKVKILGEEREVPESELIARYQKEAAAEKKFEEAAKIRKQHDQLVRALQSGQGHLVLQKLPPEVRAQTVRALLSQGDEHVSNTVREYIQEQLRFENMSPEQQEAYRLRQENERYKSQETQREKQAKAQRDQAEQNRAAEYYKQALPKHLQAAGLPVTTHSMSRMAKYVEYALDNQLNWNLADVANMVRKEYEQEDTHRFTPQNVQELIKKVPLGQMTGEQIAQLLGDEAANKLREYQVSKMKPSTPSPNQPRDQQGRFSTQEPPRRMGMAEYRAKLEAERDARSRNRG